ncbi:TetR/AcrR family transcriptional regulator [Shewanella amazonensis]|uniref:Transcriptional regulator n=1 Tax=Shewanella amazonensis (strain ATCC BAA-1098 / SB2B) TaxID=326297 RepID=A1S2T0_SHEAM|nr:TetR/AcrR family transcriptional regulator [Shewanella amazonensis]ABL98686.1 transcriptional regulator [Shewanella amazonensis SB2B]
MNTKTQDTRQHILDIGYQLVVNKGFAGVGLSELLKTAEVPKGSFYHYFKSKEQFGEALIQAYFSEYLRQLNQLLETAPGNQYQKLMHYWQHWSEQNSCQGQAGKCLVVKLAGEVSDLSEPMRLALLTGTNRIIERVAECLEKARTAGEISISNSRQTAEQLYNLWIGASLLNKIRLDDASLQQALLTTRQVLQPTA